MDCCLDIFEFSVIAIERTVILGQKTQAVGQPVKAARVKMSLPGQDDLEKLRAPQVHINPVDKEDNDQKGTTMQSSANSIAPRLI